MEIPELLEQHQRAESEIHNYFGYAEDWVKIPLQSNLEMYGCWLEGTRKDWVE